MLCNQTPSDSNPECEAVVEGQSRSAVSRGHVAYADAGQAPTIADGARVNAIMPGRKPWSSVTSKGDRQAESPWGTGQSGNPSGNKKILRPWVRG